MFFPECLNEQNVLGMSYVDAHIRMSASESRKRWLFDKLCWSLCPSLYVVSALQSLSRSGWKALCPSVNVSSPFTCSCVCPCKCKKLHEYFIRIRG